MNPFYLTCQKIPINKKYSISLSFHVCKGMRPSVQFINSLSSIWILKRKKLQRLLLVSPWLQRGLNCSKHYKIKAEKPPHEFQSNFQAHRHKPRAFHKSSKKNAHNRMLPIVFKPQTNLWTSSKIQFGRTDQLKTHLICLLLFSGTCLVACFLWFSTGVTKLHKIFFSWYGQAHDLKRVFRLAATWSCCLCHVHSLCHLHLSRGCEKGASATISHQEKCLFPLLAPSRRVEKRASNWRWEKNGGVWSSKASSSKFNNNKGML